MTTAIHIPGNIPTSMEYLYVVSNIYAHWGTDTLIILIHDQRNTNVGGIRPLDEGICPRPTPAYSPYFNWLRT